jgi:hypothetical protein
MCFDYSFLPSFYLMFTGLYVALVIVIALFLKEMGQKYGAE